MKTAAEPQVIDFTKGWRWCHAFHGDTFNRAPERVETRWERWKRKLGFPVPPKEVHYTVLVHSSVYPVVGDLVKYRSLRGLSQAEISEIEPMRDPADMFRLTLTNARAAE